jgi:pimeloyl-ACP methyl ester carboxylesterase
MSDTASPVKAPVMFVHGLWLHATSWTPWIERFTVAGYDATAPRWPGEADTVAATRADADAQAGHGIDDVVEHHAALIAELARPPILIGHSFGGTIVERLLTSGLGVAGIAIDAAPIKGVLPVPISSLRSAFPVLKNPANRHRAVALTFEQFRYGFANAVDETEARELYDTYHVPGSGVPLFQAAFANINPRTEAKADKKNPERGPMLIVSGELDHQAPWAIANASYKKQAKNEHAVTEIVEIPNRGHSLTIDSGWQEVAQTALDFIQRFVT